MKTTMLKVTIGMRISVLILICAYLFIMPEETSATGEVVHVVQPGDNLSTIASRYGTTVTILTTHNQITDANFIWIGQSINIPGKSTNTPNEIRPASLSNTDLRKSVSDFLDKPFIQKRIGDRVYYSFTPVSEGQPRTYWFQSIRNHAHENLASLAYASLGKCSEAQGMLRAFYYAQNSDGGFPYLVTAETGPGAITTTNITLPVLAWEALQIYRKCGDKTFLKDSFEAGAKNDDWWWLHSNRRDHDRCQGMFFWKNHWESVRDDAELITWTSTNGAQNQCAVDLNAYLVANDRALYHMAIELGDNRAEIFNTRASHLSNLMNSLMWNEEDSFYYGISRRGGQVRVRDIGGLMPLYAGIPSANQAQNLVDRHLGPNGDFHSGFGLPSLGKRENGYGSARRWQGGMWPSLTTLIVKGLVDYTFINEAQHITRPLVKKIIDGGTQNFWEFYDSETGDPSHAQNYIWGATVLPMAEFARIQN